MKKSMKERRLCHPVSDLMLKEIGDFVVTYALLEYQLRNLAYSITQKNTRIGRLIINNLSMKALKSVIVTGIEENSDKELSEQAKKDIKSLINKYTRYEEERNRLLHCIWGAGKDEKEAFVVKNRATEKGYKSGSKIITAEELINTTAEMSKFANMIMMLTILK